MTTDFPRYKSHEETSCFNCYGDHGGAHVFTTENAPGCGQFAQCCERCGMTTYYDLDKVEAA